MFIGRIVHTHGKRKKWGKLLKWLTPLFCKTKENTEQHCKSRGIDILLHKMTLEIV